MKNKVDNEHESENEVANDTILSRKDLGISEVSRLEIPFSVQQVISEIEQAQISRAKQDINMQLVDIMQRVQQTIRRYAADENVASGRKISLEEHKKWRINLLEKIAAYTNSAEIKEMTLIHILAWLKEWNATLSEMTAFDIDEHHRWIVQMELLSEMFKAFESNVKMLNRTSTSLLKEKKQKKKITSRGTLWKAWKERVIKRPATAHALRPDQMISDEFAANTKVSEIQGMLQELIDNAIFNKLENNAIKYISSTIVNLSIALSSLKDEVKVINLQNANMYINETSEKEKEVSLKIIQDLSEENEMLQQKLQDAELKCEYLIQSKVSTVSLTSNLKALAELSPQSSVVISKDDKEERMDSILAKEFENSVNEAQRKGTKDSGIKWDSGISYTAQVEMIPDLIEQQSPLPEKKQKTPSKDITEDKISLKEGDVSQKGGTDQYQSQKSKSTKGPYVQEISGPNLSDDKGKQIVSETKADYHFELPELEKNKEVKFLSEAKSKSFTESKIRHVPADFPSIDTKGQGSKSVPTVWERLKEMKIEHILEKSQISSENQEKPTTESMDKESKSDMSSQARPYGLIQLDNSSEKVKTKRKKRQISAGATTSKEGKTEVDMSVFSKKLKSHEFVKSKSRITEEASESTKVPGIPDSESEPSNLEEFHKAIMAFLKEKIDNTGKPVDKKTVPEEELILKETEVEKLGIIKAKMEEYFQNAAETVTKILRKYKDIKNVGEVGEKPMKQKTVVSLMPGLHSQEPISAKSDISSLLSSVSMDPVIHNVIQMILTEIEGERDAPVASIAGRDHKEKEKQRQEEYLQEVQEKSFDMNPKDKLQEERNLWKASYEMISKNLEQEKSWLQIEGKQEQQKENQWPEEVWKKQQKQRMQKQIEQDEKQKQMEEEKEQKQQLVAGRQKMKEQGVLLEKKQGQQVGQVQKEVKHLKQESSWEKEEEKQKPMRKVEDHQSQWQKKAKEQMKGKAELSEELGKMLSYTSMTLSPRWKKMWKGESRLHKRQEFLVNLNTLETLADEEHSMPIVPSTSTQSSLSGPFSISGESPTKSTAVIHEEAQALGITPRSQLIQALEGAPAPKMPQGLGVTYPSEQAQALKIPLTLEQIPKLKIPFELQKAQVLEAFLTQQKEKTLRSPITPEKNESLKSSLALEQAQAMHIPLRAEQAQIWGAPITQEQGQAHKAILIPKWAQTQDITFTPEQAQALGVTLTPQQVQALGVTLTPEQAQVLGVTLTPEQAQALGVTLTPEQAQALGVTVTPQQAQALGVTLTPQQAQALGVTLTPQQAQALGVTLTHQEAQALGVTLTPEQAQALGVTLTPEQAQALGVTLTPQQAQALGVTLSPQQVQALGVTLTPDQAQALGVTLTPQQAQALGVTLSPQQVQALGVTLTPDQAQALGVTLTPEQAQALGVTLTPQQAQVFGVTLIPEQAQALGVTFTPEQAQVLGVSLAPQQVQALGVMVTPQQAQALGVTVTPQQAPTLGVILTPQQAQAFGVNVTPEQAQALGVSLTPQQAQVLGVTVTPQQAQALGVSLTPQQAQALGVSLTPQQAQALGVTVTPQQAQVLGVTLTPEQAQALGVTLTPEQAQALGVTLTPEQAQALGVTLTPQQAQALGVTPTPQQAQALGVTLTPEQAQALGVTLTPEQAQALGVTLTPEQAQALGVTLTPEQAQALGVTLTPQQAQAPGVTVTPQQAQALGVTVTSQQAQVLGVTVTSQQAQALGVTVTSQQAQELGVTVTPQQAQAMVTVTPLQAQELGGTVTPPQAQGPGVSFTPDQAQAQGITLTPQQPQALGVTVTPKQAQALGATVAPEQAQAQMITLTPEQALGVTATPEQAQALGVTVTPEQAQVLGITLTPQQAQGITLTPEQFKALEVTLTPEKSQGLGITLTLEQAQALRAPLIQQDWTLRAPIAPKQGHTLKESVTSEQRQAMQIPLTTQQAQVFGVPITQALDKALGVTTTPQQTEALQDLLLEQAQTPVFTLTPEKAQVWGITHTHEQTQEVGITLMPKEEQALGVPLTPDQAQALETPLTAEQAWKLEVSITPEMVQEVSNTLSLKQNQALGVTPSHEQAQSFGPPSTLNQAQALGVPIISQNAWVSAVTLSPEQAESLGPPLTSDKAHVLGYCLTPEQVQLLGPPFTPGQAQPIGITHMSKQDRKSSARPINEQHSQHWAGPSSGHSLEVGTFSITDKSIKPSAPHIPKQTPILAPSILRPFQESKTSLPSRQSITSRTRQSLASSAPIAEKSSIFEVSSTPLQISSSPLTQALFVSGKSLGKGIPSDPGKLLAPQAFPSSRQTLVPKGQSTSVQFLAPEVSPTVGKLPISGAPPTLGQPITLDSLHSSRQFLKTRDSKAPQSPLAPRQPLISGVPPTSSQIPSLWAPLSPQSSLVPGASPIPGELKESGPLTLSEQCQAFHLPATCEQSPCLQAPSVLGQHLAPWTLPRQASPLWISPTPGHRPTLWAPSIPGKPQKDLSSFVSKKSQERLAIISSLKSKSALVRPSAPNFKVPQAPFTTKKFQMSEVSDTPEEIQRLRDPFAMEQFMTFQPYLTNYRTPVSQTPYINEGALPTHMEPITSLPSLTTQLPKTSQISHSEWDWKSRFPPISKPCIMTPVSGTKKPKTMAPPSSPQELKEQRYFVDVEAQRKNLILLNQPTKTSGLLSELHTTARNLVIETLHTDTVRLGYLFRKYIAYRLIQHARNNIIKQLQAIQNSGKGYESQYLYIILSRIDNYQKKVMGSWTEKQKSLEQKRNQCLRKMMSLFCQLQEMHKLNLSQPVPLIIDRKQIPAPTKSLQQPFLELLTEKDRKSDIFKKLRQEDQMEAIWNADQSTSSYPITEKTSIHSLWAQLGGYPAIPMLLQLDVQSTFRKSLQSIQSKLKKSPKQL